VAAFALADSVGSPRGTWSGVGCGTAVPAPPTDSEGVGDALAVRLGAVSRFGAS